MKTLKIFLSGKIELINSQFTTRYSQNWTVISVDVTFSTSARSTTHLKVELLSAFVSNNCWKLKVSPKPAKYILFSEYYKEIKKYYWIDLIKSQCHENRCYSPTTFRVCCGCINEKHGLPKSFGLSKLPAFSSLKIFSLLLWVMNNWLTSPSSNENNSMTTWIQFKTHDFHKNTQLLTQTHKGELK